MKGCLAARWFRRAEAMARRSLAGGVPVAIIFLGASGSAVSLLAACGGVETPRQEAGEQGFPREPSPTSGPRSAACGAARAQLRWRYELARQCAADTECHYVDGFFEVVSRDDIRRPITTSVCGGVTPLLMTANAERVRAQLADLESAARIQMEACAPLPDPFDDDYRCDRRTQAVPPSLPICYRGFCQLPSPSSPLPPPAPIPSEAPPVAGLAGVARVAR
jgi:hypothetical protein